MGTKNGNVIHSQAHSRNKVIDLNDKRRETRPQALERLFREHGTALRSFLLKRLKNQAEIEDITQEVFYRLARMNDLASRLSGNQSSNRNFIFTVANNMVVDMERRKSVRRLHQDEEVHFSAEHKHESGPEDLALASEMIAHIKTAILELKPTWRKAFIMSRYNHMSYKEISREMGVSVKQVESYITGALIKLREVTLQSSNTTQKGQTE